MQTKLLVPLDLQNEDPHEAAFAAELAGALKGKMVLLHVIDYVPMLLPVELPGGYPLPQLDVIRDAVEHKLARIAAKYKGVDVTTLVEVGGAAPMIIEVAKRDHATQIVIGSHSKRGVTRLVLGSVADRVAHTAPCPVTIVRT